MTQQICALRMSNLAQQNQNHHCAVVTLELTQKKKLGKLWRND